MMKRICIVTLASIILCVRAFAQADLPAFDKVSVADLAATDCSFEKGVPAFYLLNSAKIAFKVTDYGTFKIITERKVRIKILNAKGFEFADVSIRHLGNKHSSKITDIEGFVYFLDSSGNIVKNKLEKKDIYKSQRTRKDKLNTVKFAFPGLKPGCIIEYSYEHIENDTYEIDPWIFQEDLPVQNSYCEIKYPDFSVLDFRLVGQQDNTDNNFHEWPIDSTKDTFKKVFLMKNITSFKIEPLMTSVIDNLKRVEFSLTPKSWFLSTLTRGKILESIPTKWKRINNYLLDSYAFGVQFKKDIPGTESAIDSIKNLRTNVDKIRAVYDYVRMHVKWDSVQAVYPNNILDVWSKGLGNGASMNIIVLNLLQKTGVNCFPILISTKENGKIDTKFPHLSQFNGLDVLALDSADYYVLDASIKGQPFQIPPLNVLNRTVFTITSDNYKWLEIAETRPLLRDSIFLTAQLDKEGFLTGEVVNTFFNLSKGARIAEYKKASKANNDDVDDEEDKSNTKDIARDAPDFKTDTSWIINIDSNYLPLTEHIKFHFTLPHTGNSYFLKPYLLNSLQKNPFTDSTRTTEVDFGCNQLYKEITRIAIPPELVIENIPKSVTIRTADTSMAYTRKIAIRANVLVIENEFAINQSLYSPEDYPVLWSFFKKVYALITEGIVLNRRE